MSKTRDLTTMTDAELRAYQAGIDDAVLLASKSEIPMSSIYDCSRLAARAWWRAEEERRRRHG